jgi:hypothetical protein
LGDSAGFTKERSGVKRVSLRLEMIMLGFEYLLEVDQFFSIFNIYEEGDFFSQFLYFMLGYQV